MKTSVQLPQENFRLMLDVLPIGLRGLQSAEAMMNTYGARIASTGFPQSVPPTAATPTSISASPARTSVGQNSATSYGLPLDQSLADAVTGNDDLATNVTGFLVGRRAYEANIATLRVGEHVSKELLGILRR